MVLVRGGAMRAAHHHHHHHQKHAPRKKLLSRRMSRQDHMKEILNEQKRTEKETFDQWFQEFGNDNKKELNGEELGKLVVALRGEAGDSDDIVDKILLAIHADDTFVDPEKKQTSASSCRRREEDNGEEPSKEEKTKAEAHDDILSTLPPIEPYNQAPRQKNAILDESTVVLIKDNKRRRSTLIQKDQLRCAVEKYLVRCREHQHLDIMFTRYDTDNSGYLEAEEVRHLMLAAARGDVIDLAPDEPRAKEARCVAYKLKCLDELREKGILPEKSWREKRQSLASRHKEVMTPALSHRDPDESDVSFVLSQCDKNGDGRIDREELMLALSLWIRISKEADQYRHQSQLCLIM